MYVGIDLVEIARIARSLANPRFLLRCFSEEERAMFARRGTPPQTVAANFAAKEAFGKALGSGIRGFALGEVAVLRDGAGAPYLALFGAARQLAEARGLAFSVSLTHTDTTAAAVVLAYPAPPGIPSDATTPRR